MSSLGYRRFLNLTHLKPTGSAGSQASRSSQSPVLCELLWNSRLAVLSPDFAQGWICSVETAAIGVMGVSLGLSGANPIGRRCLPAQKFYLRPFELDCHCLLGFTSALFHVGVGGSLRCSSCGRLYELRSLCGAQPERCCRRSPADNTVETPWISQLIPQTFFCEMSCENRTALFTK